MRLPKQGSDAAAPSPPSQEREQGRHFRLHDAVRPPGGNRVRTDRPRSLPCVRAHL